MFNFSKLIDDVASNVVFFLVSLALMAGVYIISILAQKFIEKKKSLNLKSQKSKINRMTVIALLSAVAFVLMFFEFPIPFIAPPFYELDFSEVPALIGAFMFGPSAGVAIEGIKILLKIVIKGTTTAFVGDLSNYILGCVYVIPAAVIYHMNKTKKNAIIGMTVSGILLIIVGTVFNALYLLPKFSELSGMPMDLLIGMGTEVNASVSDVYSFVAICVAPFNLLKSLADGIIVSVLYKYVSRVLKHN